MFHKDALAEQGKRSKGQITPSIMMRKHNTHRRRRAGGHNSGCVRRVPERKLNDFAQQSRKLLLYSHLVVGRHQWQWQWQDNAGGGSLSQCPAQYARRRRVAECVTWGLCCICRKAGGQTREQSKRATHKQSEKSKIFEQ